MLEDGHEEVYGIHMFEGCILLTCWLNAGTTKAMHIYKDIKGAFLLYSSSLFGSFYCSQVTKDKKNILNTCY